MVESYGRANLGAKGLVRGDILSGETYQRAPDFTRAVCVHARGGQGATRGLRVPRRGSLQTRVNPDDLITSMFVPPNPESEVLAGAFCCSAT